MANQTQWQQLRADWALMSLYQRERDDCISGAPKMPAG
jgi:hypothetical protein